MTTQRIDLTKESIESILIIKPSSLGDIIHTLPCLNALRLRFPKARIDWLVAENNAAILQGHPQIDDLILFSRERWPGPLQAMLDLPGFHAYLQSLATHSYDLAIDFQGLFRSGLFTQASKARHRIGFSKAREAAWLFYNHGVDLPHSEMHAVDRYASLLHSIGMDVDTRELQLPMSKPANVSVDSLMESADMNGHRIVAFQAITRWDSKNWLMESYVKLGQLLSGVESIRIAVLGGEKDEAVCRDLAYSIGPKATSFAGCTNLPEMVEMIRRSSLFVGADSGPTHIAAALKIPVVGLYGPTNPILCGPYGQLENVLQAKIDCIQCYQRSCPKTNPNHMRCMRDLTPEQVFEYCRNIL